MTNVTRIRKGPHPTPRPSGDVMDYQHVPMSLRTRAIVGAIGLGLVATGLVAGVLALGDHQSDPIPGRSPQPTGADYEAQENQTLNGS